MQQIKFDYFYRIFLEECTRILYEKQLENFKSKFSEYNDKREFVFEFFNSDICTKEERIEIYNKIIHDICVTYLSLSKSDIDVIPTDVFELIKLILNNIHDNEYKENFLTSLQLIYQTYVEALESGRPMIWGSNDDGKEKGFNIVLDSNYNILDFGFNSVDLLEQDKIITNIVMMLYNNELGPIENASIRVRKDI